ncbi:MFS transporter [Thermocladium modestius]|uniref:MFS transporter n=1 Tax=Thermocladium modestius TaxID=62609 RepID=A0A830GUB1_9CREN|nr:MFS transporter [Thermocladium modestius]GGP19647.1 MFS transporter [Thermocladium modestius]
MNHSVEGVRARSIAGAYLGWVLDGYDALLVVPIMPLLGRLFFPGPYSLLGGLSTLVATLVGRPLGAAVMGYVGDRFGRRVGLLATVTGYSFSALGLALMPTYASMGAAAPASFLSLRFLQGAFLGGEFGPGTAMIMEWSKWRSEFASAFTQSGYPIGVIMATLVNAGFASMMGPSFYAVGWRIYLATGAVAALITLIVRSRLAESPKWSPPRVNPLTALFKSGGALVWGILFTGGLLTVYYSTYLVYPDLLAFLGRASEIPGLTLAATVAATAAVLLAGSLAAGVGSKPLIVGSLVAAVVLAPYSLLINPSPVSLVALAFVENFPMGLVPHVLINEFGQHYRASALGVSYNWGLLIGGWAPMLVGLASPLGLGMLMGMAGGAALAVAGLVALTRR